MDRGESEKSDGPKALRMRRSAGSKCSASFHAAAVATRAWVAATSEVVSAPFADARAPQRWST
eukprot:6446383-Lingulodinium_polyedra.AAC.1